MGLNKPGPKAKPTALRILHNDRVGTINTQEPKPPPGLPTCPAGATDEVRQIWTFTVEQLDKMGCVSLADRDMLYVYCEAVALHRYYSQMIAHKQGEYAETDNMDVEMGKNLAAAVRSQKVAAEVMRQFGAHFGLTPSSRSGIKVGEKAGDGSGAERFLSA